MKRAAFLYRAPHEPAVFNWLDIAHLRQHRNRTKVGNWPKPIPIDATDHGIVGAAEASRTFRNRIEHRLNVCR